MHMADALVSPIVAGSMYACSAAVAGYSVKKVHISNKPETVPVMGVMGAFVFAAQMINFTIPATGSSGHLCGGMLLSAILGPYAGFLSIIGVLFVQALLFADGGLLAFGCNVWNMAFYGCFIGAFLIWQPILKYGASKRKITAASIIGCMLTLQLGSFSVILETMASGITELPFTAFTAAMQPVHLAIGFVEGLITAVILNFIYEARPELLWGIGSNSVNGRLSLKKTLALLVAGMLFTAGILSLCASSYPDGLEWSLAKITGKTELTADGSIHQIAADVQETVSLLPDYAFKHSDTSIGTPVSGIAGSIIVAAVCTGIYLLIRLIKNKKGKL